MAIIKEFKDFILHGNVVDLAVAVIVGAAFTGIVSSLVDDVITPGMLTPALKAAKVSNLADLHYGAIKYGTFLAAVIKFIIFSFILFLIVKGIKAIEKKSVPPAAGPSATEKLLADILVELKTRKL